MIALPANALIRWRAWVIAAWAALAVVFAPRAAHVQHFLDVRGRASALTESNRSSDLLRHAFPNPFAEYVAIVVHGPVPLTNPRFAVVVDSLTAATARQSYISQVVSLRSIGESTFVSKDRHTTFLIAALTPAHAEDITNNFVPELRTTLREAMSRMPGTSGFDVKITGNPALDYDVRTISAEDTERSERRILPLTLVVLVVAFGALVAALLPVVVGFLAITIALGLVTIAARYQPMSEFVLNITTMVGLGVGIDYSLFIVTRFREELNRGLIPTDAAVRTIETAGSAVVTSGLTVIVGFLGLVIMTPMTDTRSVGTGGLLVVAVAVLPPPPSSRRCWRSWAGTSTVLGGWPDRSRASRAHWLGALVAVAGPSAVARRRGREHRDRALTAPPGSAAARPAGDQLFPAIGVGQGLAALRSMGAKRRDLSHPHGGAAPEGESALAARRIAGLRCSPIRS